MKALRVARRGVEVCEIEKPERRDEVIVRVLLSGICNTDLEIARGYAAFTGTLGHEFVGQIEEAADPRVLGQRVVGEINAGCRICDMCLAGDPRHCPARTVLGIAGRDGSHAEFLRLPLVNLLPVPERIPDEHAVFTEPLAAACAVMERVPISKATQVAVVGDGKLGLLCAQSIALTGAPVLLVGKHLGKLRIAERRGIATTLTKNIAKRKREFDVVVDASGSASGFGLSLNLLRPRGTLVLKSTFHGTTEVETAGIVVDEISVVGSRCGRFAPALDLLKKGAVDVDSLISEEYPLSQGVVAMDRARQRGILKVLLRP